MQEDNYSHSGNFRTCHICRNLVGKRESCQRCTEWVKNEAPHPDTMTGRQRVDELKMWFGVLEIDFGLMHERIAALVGRDVWTHEMGSSNKEALFAEALNASIDEPVSDEEATRRAVESIPDNIKVVRVNPDDIDITNLDL